MTNQGQESVDVEELIFDAGFREALVAVEDHLDRAVIDELESLAAFTHWEIPSSQQEARLWALLGQEALDLGLIEPPERRPVPPDPSPQYVPREGEACSEVALDGFEVYGNDIYADSHRLINRYLAEFEKAPYYHERGRKRTKIHPSLDAVDATKGEARARLMVAAVRHWAWLVWRYKTFCANLDFGKARRVERYEDPVRYILDQTLQRGTTLPPSFLAEVLLHRATTLGFITDRRARDWDDGRLIKVAARTLREQAVDDEMRGELRKWKETLVAEKSHPSYYRSEAELQKQVGQIDEWLGEARPFRLNRGEAWSDHAMAALEAMPAEQQIAWSALLEHALTASAAKPNAKWAATANKLLERVGTDEFVEQVRRWFELAAKPRTELIEFDERAWLNPNLMPDELNAEFLKGLAWFAGITGRGELAAGLREVSMSGLKKVPNIGPRAVKLSNAAVWALSQLPGMNGVAQLAILKSKVTHKPTVKTIDKAYAATAEREGVSPDDLEELAVPDYGLTEVGKRVETLGDFTAELLVTGTTTTELRWKKPDGKVQKSVPKAVKDNDGDALRELKASAKDIQKMLPAQRDRIDLLFLSRKSWEFATWAERYLNHPLVGTLARRLIWEFDHGEDRPRVEAIWLDGALVDALGRPLEVDDNTAQVSLWHPIGRSEEKVIAWRRFLEERQIRQPFKQAHREVYLLTDAERETRTYSNRYAAHVLRQHQFNALCGIRGWKNKLRLMVDDTYPPAARDLPVWNLRAEFWIDGVGEEFGLDTNDAGTYLYLGTDQVRFYHLGAAENWSQAVEAVYRSGAGGPGRQNINEPVPVAEIAPLVFSEIMRDVDLFVGVASVGNDPQWQDGGPEGRYRDYWHGYSFGELTATAETRRELLAALIPRLKIADRCSLEDRFLVVRGDLRTYKIHLGSANILMEPNDQYLCIVSGRGRAAGPAGKVFLPFEGDERLAVILSKAFMLADDKKITDSTILSQIRR